jgi:hypothetical protein
MLSGSFEYLAGAAQITRRRRVRPTNRDLARFKLQLKLSARPEHRDDVCRDGQLGVICGGAYSDVACVRECHRLECTDASGVGRTLQSLLLDGVGTPLLRRWRLVARLSEIMVVGELPQKKPLFGIRMWDMNAKLVSMSAPVSHFGVSRAILGPTLAVALVAK